MSYQETIDYLFKRLPMFSRIGAAAIKPDLVNTIKLCAALGDPHKKFKSIHVAGTNGKGSVSHMLAAILQEAGYKTGLYTSPHLHDFRERIKINGEMIPEKKVVDFTIRIQPQIDQLDPSFFEITVAMAFDHFAEEEVDIAVIETGLGGRLDSTNIIMPELSIITNIGWDHMNLLGNTLVDIAREKAGIIKKDTPAVIGEVIPETKKIFEEKSSSVHAPLFFASQKRQALNWYWVKHELVVETATEHQTDHRIYRLDLTGLYQVRNMLTVLESCAQLQRLGWNITDETIHKALHQVKKLTGLHGRWEIVHHSPTVVLDVAHNIDGIKELVRQIEVTDHHGLHIVIGIVKDKNVTDILQLLPPAAKYYFTKAQIPRALPETELAEMAAAIGIEGNSYPDVNLALRQAIDHANSSDLIIVCGSVYLVGEVNLSI